MFIFCLALVSSIAFAQQLRYQAPAVCETKAAFLQRFAPNDGSHNTSSVYELTIENDDIFKASLLVRDGNRVLLQRTLKAPICTEALDAAALALHIYFDSLPNVEKNFAPTSSLAIESLPPKSESRLGFGLGMRSALTKTIAPAAHVDFELMFHPAHWLRWHIQLGIDYSIGDSLVSSSRIVSQLITAHVQTCPLWPTLGTWSLRLRVCAGVDIGAFMGSRIDGDRSIRAVPWVSPFLQLGLEWRATPRWHFWLRGSVGYVALRPRITDESGLLFSVPQLSGAATLGGAYRLW